MKVHFIAIGGSVMHQLAISLQKKGYIITGSDDEIFEPAKSNLKNAGILPNKLGWDENNITEDINAIILGMHARKDNPEILKAKHIGLKIYSFPEYIYNESIDKLRVAIGGSHGKTTTTSMIMHVLNKVGKDFDYIVGAKLEGFEQSVKISNASLIICEADEYPASAIEPIPKFHFLNPHIAVLTGLAWDHINVFPTFDIYKEQFIIFINKIKNGGCLIYNETEKDLNELVLKSKRSDIIYLPYGLPSNSINKGVTSVSIGENSKEITVFGHHNLLNLNASYLVCRELGISPRSFLSYISDFQGASKRLEILFKGTNFNIYRDFAHAPSKVKASTSAVKMQFPDRKLIAILELHTYSSLNIDFMVEYRGTMDMADECAVFYSAHALEMKKMPALDKDIVKMGFGKDGIEVITDKNILVSWIKNRELTNCSILIMSSGSFDGLDILHLIIDENI